MGGGELGMGGRDEGAIGLGMAAEEGGISVKYERHTERKRAKPVFDVVL